MSLLLLDVFAIIAFASAGSPVSPGGGFAPPQTAPEWTPADFWQGEARQSPIVYEVAPSSLPATESNRRKGFRGGFAAGEYGYLNPAGGGVVIRFHLENFNPVTTVDLAQSDPLLTDFNFGFADATYGYMLQDVTGKIVRFTLDPASGDAPTSWDISKINPDFRGFKCGFTTGGVGARAYIFGFGEQPDTSAGLYLHGHVFSFMLDQFNNSMFAQSANLGSDFTGMTSCFNLGGHAYVLASRGNGVQVGVIGGKPGVPLGKVGRISIPSLDVSSMEVLDVKSADAALVSFSSMFHDGTYLYLAPGAEENKRWLARLSLSTFNLDSLQAIDVKPAYDDGSNCFMGGFTDASIYGYLVPAPGGKSECAGKGKIARFKLATFSQADVNTIDLLNSDPSLHGFNFAFLDSSYDSARWAFLVPFATYNNAQLISMQSKMVRIRINEPPFVLNSFSVAWYNGVNFGTGADGAITQTAGGWGSCYAASQKYVVSLTFKFQASGESFVGFCCDPDCLSSTERGSGLCRFSVYYAHGGASNKWHLQDGTSTGAFAHSDSTTFPDWANDEWSLRHTPTGAIEYSRNGLVFYTSVGVHSGRMMARFDGGQNNIDGNAGAQLVHGQGLTIEFSQASDAYLILNGYYCWGLAQGVAQGVATSPYIPTHITAAGCRDICDDSFQAPGCASYSYSYDPNHVGSRCQLYQNPTIDNYKADDSNGDVQALVFCALKKKPTTTTTSTAQTTTSTTTAIATTTTAIATTSTSTSTTSPALTTTTTIYEGALVGSFNLECSDAASFVQEPNVTEVLKIAIAEVLECDIAWITNVTVELVELRRLQLSSGEHRRLDFETTTKNGVKISFEVDIPKDDSGVAVITPTIVLDRFDAVSLEEATEVIDKVIKSNLLTGGKSYEVKVAYKVIRKAARPTTLPPAAEEEESSIVMIVVIVCCASMALVCGTSSLLFYIVARRRNAELKMPLRAHTQDLCTVQYLFPPEAITEEAKDTVNGYLTKLLDSFTARVFIVYANGKRPEDVEDSGPGAFFAAATAKSLHMQKVTSFMLLPGMTMEELDGNLPCRVVAVLETSALYDCSACLRQIHMAMENNMEVLLLRFEAGLPGVDERWSRVVGEDAIIAEEVKQMLRNVQEIPSPPMTVQMMPEVLETIAIDIKSQGMVQLTLKMHGMLGKEDTEEVDEVKETVGQKITRTMTRMMSAKQTRRDKVAASKSPSSRSPKNLEFADAKSTGTKSDQIRKFKKKDGNPKKVGKALTDKSGDSTSVGASRPQGEKEQLVRKAGKERRQRVGKASSDMGTGTEEVGAMRPKTMSKDRPIGKASSADTIAIESSEDALGEKKSVTRRKPKQGASKQAEAETQAEAGNIIHSSVSPSDFAPVAELSTES